MASPVYSPSPELARLVPAGFVVVRGYYSVVRFAARTVVVKVQSFETARFPVVLRDLTRKWYKVFAFKPISIKV